MSASEDQFNKALLDAVNDALVKVFGDETSRAVKFYIDPKIIIVDADVYANSLVRMFQEGAKVVLEAIIENLSQKTGVSKGESERFGEVVGFLKQNFKP